LNNIRHFFNLVKVHPLFWVIAGLGIMTGHFKVVLIIFTIVTIHEMGHYLAARFFKWKVTKIMLLPFGGVAELDEHGNKPLKEELIIILAGPAQHVWMIGFSFLLYKIGFVSPAYFELFLFHNIVILVFNLLPIWPLDGGKLILILTSYLYPFKKALIIAYFSSALFLLMFSTWTIITYPLQLNVWLIIGFLFLTNVFAFRQRNYTHIRFLMERYYDKDRIFPKTKAFAVKKTAKVSATFSWFYRDVFHIFLTNNGKKTDERELLKAHFSEKRSNCTIDDLFM
jgi:stage IV sporulation protein FB